MLPRLAHSLRLTSPMLAAASMFVAAGGYIHAREWLTLYRHVPADSPGAAVVRLGFPLNAGDSLVFAAALVIFAIRRSRLSPYAVAAAIAFQASSLAALIVTRTGSLFGWTEPAWTFSANATRAVEVGALETLLAVAFIGLLDRQPSRYAALPVQSRRTTRVT